MGFSTTAQQKKSSLGDFMKKSLRALMFVAVVIAPSNIHLALAAEVRRPSEWDKTWKAKKEGKIVIAIPPANELRKEMETVLKQKFGLKPSLSPPRARATQAGSPRSARRE